MYHNIAPLFGFNFYGSEYIPDNLAIIINNQMFISQSNFNKYKEENANIEEILKDVKVLDIDSL